MRISYAPMEGITIYCYRNAHSRLFPEGIDRYYTPFLSVYKQHAIKKRDMREIAPENNALVEGRLIPQIMTNKADEIIWALSEMHERGFEEVNLNMGCPVGTVVSKHKGSGMLEEPAALDELFAQVFESEEIKHTALSVKTRIGLKDPKEYIEIFPVLNKYPFCNVIVHPRVRTQMYQGEPDMEIFKWAYENSKNPISYNGNIFTKDDYDRIVSEFPDLKEVMIGRGLVANPGLAREIVTGQVMGQDELRSFIETMEKEYKVEIPAEESIMHKMKEIWFYVGGNFKTTDGSKIEPYIHKIRVSKNPSEYRNAVRNLYRSCGV